MSGDVNAAAQTMDLADVRKRAGWALDTTRMAKSGYAPRKAQLARWVIALVSEVESQKVALNIAIKGAEQLRAEQDAARHELRGQSAAAQANRAEVVRLRVEKQQLEEERGNAEETLANVHLRLVASLTERDKLVAREQRLQEALERIEKKLTPSVTMNGKESWGHIGRLRIEGSRDIARAALTATDPPEET